ncbi:hypothetical protein A2755_02045 [Candidatus Wolfebacteria bacterium RIFCSPHIGHO2_01_FULL_48_22]|uniref:Uncharacterized protein n=2 Tax=Candidatus Wolfeibacteriota TaxID=1752735 RepID=A0A1F8DTM5_9BACT|nr:MAG: hypothetical protein A2755_02045 [Candidatus Wolfebacteria bacterium RIFCSPHIGHO2_01_FULL_48_22]OGM92333.1 MAG: hypothetical protein A2935_01025 [Candidatus Wolfebacteria bacterium RIFCSPLOWO2_01_FULL_47_17b]
MLTNIKNFRITFPQLSHRKLLKICQKAWFSEHESTHATSSAFVIICAGKLEATLRCDALWILSRTLCRRHPGNNSHHGEYKARKTELIPRKVAWDKTSQRRTYFETCGKCPVQATCEFNVPSAEYYRRGVLQKRGKREKPPDLFVDDADLIKK